MRYSGSWAEGAKDTQPAYYCLNSPSLSFYKVSNFFDKAAVKGFREIHRKI
jgi:peptide methionine sulfoxide reductase MsrB